MQTTIGAKMDLGSDPRAESRPGAAFVKQLGKKKWMLTLGLFVVGSVIAFKTAATLGEWTAFATMLLGVFAAGDVTDKKLNGGKYDEK